MQSANAKKSLTHLAAGSPHRIVETREENHRKELAKNLSSPPPDLHVPLLATCPKVVIEWEIEEDTLLRLFRD